MYKIRMMYIMESQRVVFPLGCIALSLNDYNQAILYSPKGEGEILTNRPESLKHFETKPDEGSHHPVRQIDDDVDDIIIFCGQFADCKCLDALLHAASIFELMSPVPQR